MGKGENKMPENRETIKNQSLEAESSNLTRLDLEIMEVEYQFNDLKTKLISNMEYVRDCLNRAIAQLEAEPETSRLPNSRGVVQGNGLDIDIGCAELYRINEHLKQLHRIKKFPKSEL
jgi:hypothetical protein